MLFGRFIYKYYRKKRTTYGITTERAIVMVGRSTAEVPLRQQPVTIRRSRNSRHASVILKDSRTANGWVNSGMELFVARSGLPIAFYDVAEPDAMLSALDKARSGLTRSR